MVWPCSSGTCTVTRMVAQFGGGPRCRMIYPQQRTKPANASHVRGTRRSTLTSTIPLAICPTSGSPIAPSASFALAAVNSALGPADQCRRNSQPGDSEGVNRSTRSSPLGPFFGTLKIGEKLSTGGVFLQTLRFPFRSEMKRGVSCENR